MWTPLLPLDVCPTDLIFASGTELGKCYRRRSKDKTCTGRMKGPKMSFRTCCRKKKGGAWSPENKNRKTCRVCKRDKPLSAESMDTLVVNVSTRFVSPTFPFTLSCMICTVVLYSSSYFTAKRLQPTAMAQLTVAPLTISFRNGSPSMRISSAPYHGIHVSAVQSYLFAKQNKWGKSGHRVRRIEVSSAGQLSSPCLDRISCKEQALFSLCTI